MGLTRSGKHKRKSTGGKRRVRMIKKLHSMARQPSNTRIGATRVRPLRVRGGNIKMRALRLESGSFSLKTHNASLKAKMLQVVYHGSSNELVRTNTLTKSSVVKIDPTPFKPVLAEILAKDPALREIDELFFSEAEAGNLYAIITSRPGQTGSADGHILQASELQFYLEKFRAKQKK